MENNIRRNRVFPTGFNRFKLFTMLRLVVVKQLFVVKLFRLFNNGEPVHSKLTVLRAGDILLWSF